MKFTTAIAALAGVAIAAPVAETESLEKRATPINYVQNYNGNLANFKYNEGAGTYSASWNNPGDFVVGLGWNKGSARTINFKGSYQTGGSSYYAVYGWLNNPLTEYYVVEDYSYDPCSTGTQVGSLTSDGSSYKICTHTQVNQPSISGTKTFGQFFSVRQNKRTSGSVNMANHFNAWSQHGFKAGDYNYQVFATEAFGSTGSASVTVSEGTSSDSGSGSGSGSVSVSSSATPSKAPVTTSIPSSTAAPAGGSSSGSVAVWGQCGGQGATFGACVSGTKCVFQNQCEHGDASSHVLMARGTTQMDKKANGNNTNIFRIFASIGRGAVKDENDETIEQIIEYFPGIGTNEKSLRKWNSGVTGDGYAEQIAEVYKYCCRHIVNPEDDLWFYGFSRGAYVLFAIKDKSRSCPKIGFMGLLDTVKRVNNDPDTSHTLAFHSSVRHVRHALALNDTRFHYKPEMYGPMADSDSLQGRSLVEAWFVGAHSDIGGGARDDGLSLYPLQWLLIESQHHGLVLQHNSQTMLIEDPLSLVFPSRKQDSPTDQDAATEALWTYQYANGIKVQMYDLRSSHNHGNMQTVPTKLTKKRSGFENTSKSRSGSVATILSNATTAASSEMYASRRSTDDSTRQGKSGFLKGLFGRKKSTDTSSHSTMPREHDNVDEPSNLVPVRHFVRLHSGFPHILYQQHRNPFKDGKLQGYSERPLGCIIHPSVYLIMDVYARFGIELAMKPFEKDIDRFRNEQHPNMRDPWLTLQTEAVPQTSVKACRILVCGRTGVGKSTLINKVFGVPMTIESHMKQGDHNINEAFESEHHPGIIIHDSRGFQAGDTRELGQFQDFIKKRSGISNPKESLHAIWICMQTDTDRVVQTSENEIFKILAKYAAHIPIIIVGTKKDNFLNQQETVARRDLKKSGISDWNDLDNQSRERAEQNLDARREEVKDELQKIPNLDLDSIQILCDNILKCFGFPKIDPASVNNIMNKIIGWNLYGFLAQQIAQSVTLGTGVAVLCIFSLGGALPLVAGLSLLEVPTAGRMIVKCACDLILILDRAFKHGGKFVTSQDIELACQEYVATTVQGGWSKRRQVHAQVKGLIPIVSRKFWNAVRISVIKVGMEEIIENNRWGPSEVTSRTDSALDLVVTRLSSESLRDENELEDLLTSDNA
ncbi:glycoside hydrolase, partial [Aureobasidium melanogenum]